MANLKLKDGASQEQIYPNISTIRVPKEDGGYAEFTSGGGTRKNAVLVNGIQLKVKDFYFAEVLKLLSGTSPETVQLYIDAPKAVNLEIFRTIGALQLSGSGQGAYKTTMKLQSDVPAFTMTELDENTNRYMIELSVEYDASKVSSLSSGCCYAVCQYTIDGVYSEYRDGEYVLFGPNAAKSLTMIIPDIDGHAPYSVYDLREDMGENLTMCRMARSTLKKVYCPKGVTLVDEHAFFRQPNLELVDFSLAESVPTLVSDNFLECGDSYQIKVPAALYDEWISAKNWSSVASHIVAV